MLKSQISTHFRLRIFHIFERLLCLTLFRFFLIRRNFNFISNNYSSRLISDASNKACVWFHAASAGELEILWEVILETSRTGSKIVITVFSVSGLVPLKRLVDELEVLGNCVAHFGLSPFESYWEASLKKFKPDLFVTAKYEAWPDIWCSLSLLNIPILIVNASSRPSLLLAKKMCTWLGVTVPSIIFTAQEQEALNLAQHFPKSDVVILADPRWDRVMKRSRIGNLRAQKLVEQLKELPRPWGVLGQIWPEDLNLWLPSLIDFTGTLWIVPHKVDLKHMKATLRKLEEPSQKVSSVSRYILTSALNEKSEKNIQEMGGKVAADSSTPFVIVDEMGFLSELYSAVDWAYVGGGFTRSPHSTIEPAIYGIPVSVGPKRIDEFPEIRQLQIIDQLTVLHDAPEIKSWLTKVSTFGKEKSSKWECNRDSRLGASKQISTLIQQIVSKSSP